MSTQQQIQLTLVQRKSTADYIYLVTMQNTNEQTGKI